MKSSATSNSCTKSSSHRRKSGKKIKMVDVAVETDDIELHTPVNTHYQPEKQGGRQKINTRSQATSPIIENLQNLFQPAIDFVSQIRERKLSMRSAATSPIAPPSARLPANDSTKVAIATNFATASTHNVLLEEMRRQIACVRNIAESMDNVVDVEEMEAELERKGKAIVNAECKRIRERNAQKRKLAKMSKSLHKHMSDMEESVSAVESDRSPFDGGLSDIEGWNLHGNADVTLTSEFPRSMTPTLSQSSSENELLPLSSASVGSPMIIRVPHGLTDICLRVR